MESSKNPGGQVPVVVTNFSVKDLFDAIPPHCFERSAWKSAVYPIWDLVVIGGLYKLTVLAEASLPHFVNETFQPFARFALWSFYGCWAGLFGMGLWVVAHECGHQAFSTSKTLNNAVGWVLHSALGVPYHSWRISHAKHHASTCHMTQDQVFIPKSRSEKGLPAFDPEREDLVTGATSSEIKHELYEALGDSPIGAFIGCVFYLLMGFPLYLLTNIGGQARYPSNTNHFKPSSIVFSPHHRNQILLSDVGIFLWLAGIISWAYYRGFSEMFRVYFVPYLWVNHWLILITFLQHTDPLIPHYRADMFTFPRGALSTMDRSLLGDLGSIMGWIGAHATHGISETHVLHHVTSKIPHYHAWEAAAALRKKLAEAGINLQGAPGGWKEMYRVFRECKFVEDQGSVLFYKNAYGVAAAKPIYPHHEVSDDSGIEFTKGK